MQKSENKRQSTVAHRRVKASTTLNRKYVRRPAKKPDAARGAEVEVAIKRSPKIRHFDITPVETVAPVQEEPIKPAEKHVIQVVTNNRMKERSGANVPAVRKATAKELKDQAIKKALAASSKAVEKDNAKKAKAEKKAKLHFGIGRVVLALSCAAAVVFAIVYFVGTNMPDISMRVAAMQTGINASYPGYVPREFSLSDIGSEEGKVTLNFRSGDNKTFSLAEESSSWDSNALLNNYVKPTYGEDYSIVREQGLTIYMNGSNAAWVNGGVVYKLSASPDTLTKKQIRSIAVSL